MKLPEIDVKLPDYIAGLDAALAFHGHICPGMYNGVKMALGAQKILGLESYPNKELILVTEIDRCLTDALMIITGCRMGRKTLKFKDLGKFAATFVLLDKDLSIRVSQNDGIVKKAMGKLEAAGIDYHDHLKAAWAFHEIPFYEHFSVTEIETRFSEFELPGKAKIKENCAMCGETVMDKKHVIFENKPYCRSCKPLQG